VRVVLGVRGGGEMGGGGWVWVLRQKGVIPIFFWGGASINRLFMGDEWMHTCTTLLFSSFFLFSFFEESDQRGAFVAIVQYDTLCV
jgi:hypothetical protein